MLRRLMLLALLALAGCSGENLPGRTPVLEEVRTSVVAATPAPAGPTATQAAAEEPTEAPAEAEFPPNTTGSINAAINGQEMAWYTFSATDSNTGAPFSSAAYQQTKNELGDLLFTRVEVWGMPSPQIDDSDGPVTMVLEFLLIPRTPSPARFEAGDSGLTRVDVEQPYGGQGRVRFAIGDSEDKSNIYEMTLGSMEVSWESAPGGTRYTGTFEGVLTNLNDRTKTIEIQGGTFETTAYERTFP